MTASVVACAETPSLAVPRLSNLLRGKGLNDDQMRNRINGFLDCLGSSGTRG
jgi:hypothetical protein